MLWRKTQSVWTRGERAAARYLRRNGFRVLARNLRLPVGEIDLLCIEKSSGTIVIVEVKAREYDERASKQIDPVASITRKKQAKLRTLAHAIQRMPAYRGMPIRIDAVGVCFTRGRRGAEVRHYRGCVGDP